MKKHFKKFIFVLPILIIVFSIVFCVPVSALEFSDNFQMPISQPNVSDSLAYMEIVVRDGNGNYFAHVFLISFFATANNVQANPFCNLILNPDNDIGEDYKITLSDRDDYSYFNVVEINQNGDVCVYGSSVQGDVSIPFRWYEVVSLKIYGSIYVDPLSEIEIYQGGGIPYTISYGSDSVSLTLLNAILSTLQNQNNNDVTGAINNQTDKLQQNQNENTDKILNGWQNDDSVDSGDTGDLNDIEGALIDDTKGNADNSISDVTDNVIGSVQRLASSFGAVGSMFRQLTVRIPDFNLFIYFSLLIGVVPLIVGLTVQGLRSSDRASARSRSQADYKRGYNAGYTKGKGG